MKLPTDVSGWELAKIAVKLGFEIRRQSGSHLILKKGEKLLVIPQHRHLKKGDIAPNPEGFGNFQRRTYPTSLGEPCLSLPLY